MFIVGASLWRAVRAAERRTVSRHKMDWESAVRNIEDRLFPRMALDVWERVVYYHLLRRTRIDGQDGGVFGVAALAQTLGLSDSRVRDALRSLNEKGCIKIENRSRQGHHLRVLLPEEIGTLYYRDPDKSTEAVLEDIDFYTGRRYVTELLARESSRCFYCLREIPEAECVLDHATPQVSSGGNSYRNVVACCHSCNSLKQSQEPDTFIRALYRRGVLNVSELEDRLAAVAALQRGDLVPAVGGG